MMEGIQILSQQPVMGSDLLGLKIFIVGTIVAIIVRILFECLCFKNGVGLLIGIAIVFIAMITAACIESTHKVPTGQTEYKVIIDDNVSMTEFHKHYELVGQDGEIFIIRDKVPTSE